MMESELKDKLSHIRLVITDVDGVLTDGGMYYSESGDELKKFNVRDGVGVILLQLAGLKVGAFTGESVNLVERRAKKIGLDFIFTGVKDKIARLRQYLAENGYEADQVAYIGDEVNDYCLFGNVGVFMCPADANPVIKEKADFVLESLGGQGALRETAQIILIAQGKLQQALDLYVKNLTG